MTFDFTGAIANYPQHNGQSDVDLLRDRYPELSKFFDRVEADRDDFEGLDSDEVQELRSDFGLMEERMKEVNAQLKHLLTAVGLIRSMAAAKSVEPMLRDVHEKMKNLRTDFVIPAIGDE